MPEPTPYADLHIALSSPADNQYRVDLRYYQPDDLTERNSEGGSALFKFDDLVLVKRDPRAYGELLRQALFGDSASPRSQYYLRALADAQGARQELRVRILVDRSARRLQDLRWETLLNPDGSDFLATNANQPYSRFLTSDDWQRIELRSRTRLRALVFVANPTTLAAGIALVAGPNLPNQQFAEVPVEAEVSRAKLGLKDLPADQIEVIQSIPGQPGLASFKNLKTALGRGCDILYLVCHGALLPDDEDPDIKHPYLLLENDDGTHDRRNAGELVDFVKNMPADLRPRLAVLASCQSGGQGKVPGGGAAEEERSYDDGALSALGPRLVEAGVPAVVAQQDNVRMDTIASFTPAFFGELLRSGQVDKAMALARNTIRGKSDWWVPALYLRLRGGRLWFESGYGSEVGDAPWKGIKTRLRLKKCTPVLGGGMIEFLTGPARSIAYRWAEENGYPFERHNQEELHQVAEFLDLIEGELNLVLFFYQLVAEELGKRFEAILPPHLKGKDSKTMDTDELVPHVQEMITEIGKARRLSQTDPYRILAGLSIPIYITTNPDTLLEDALREQNKNPESVYFCWKQGLITPAAREDYLRLFPPESSGQKSFIPDPNRPLVYHLFGRLDQPKSLVLTEDDYFEFMMSINNSDHPLKIPDVLLNAWLENTLLFLGFQMTDWNFRLLFRSILTEERRKARTEIRSIAVQLRPGDDNLRPASARKILEKYFGEEFNIYYGSTEDYLRDLAAQPG